MRKILRHTWAVFAVGIVFLTGCNLIDEVLEVCREDFKIDYRICLITNKQAEMDDKLGEDRDLPLQLALEDYLKGVFSDYGRDLDLSFYEADSLGQRTEHRTEMMNARQATYSFSLQADDYQHLALANLQGNGAVNLQGAESFQTSCLNQAGGDFVESHSTGIFTARRPLEIVENESRTFEVNLYMANDAAALILHRDSCDYKAIRAEFYDLADKFYVNDSLYAYDVNAGVRTAFIDAEPYVEPARQMLEGRTTKAGEIDTTNVPFWKKMPAMFCGVGFPSRDESPSTAATTGAIWRIVLYVTLQDDTVTQSIISLGKPLKAGNLMILRGWLKGNGGFTPDPPVPPGPGGGDGMVVGVDVQLNWQEGLQFTPEL